MSDPEQGGEMERSEAELLQKPARKYYSIREVSELLGVKAHVLRYWETQFSFLRPRKHAGGARMYQDRDLDLLRSIREMLYDRGYTIAGARQRLNQERRAREETRPQIEMDFVGPADHRRLREIRDELAEIVARLREKPGGLARRASRGRRGSSEGEPVEGGGDISVDPGESDR